MTTLEDLKKLATSHHVGPGLHYDGGSPQRGSPQRGLSPMNIPTPHAAGHLPSVPGAMTDNTMPPAAGVAQGAFAPAMDQQPFLSHAADSGPSIFQPVPVAAAPGMGTTAPAAAAPGMETTAPAAAAAAMASGAAAMAATPRSSTSSEPLAAPVGGGKKLSTWFSSRLGRYALLAALVAALVFTMRTIATLMANRRPDADPLAAFTPSSDGEDDDEGDDDDDDGSPPAPVDVEAPATPRKTKQKRKQRRRRRKARRAELFTVPEDSEDSSDAGGGNEADSGPVAAAPRAASPPPPADPLFCPLDQAN